MCNKLRPKLGESLTSTLLELHNKAASILSCKEFILHTPETPELDSPILQSLSRRYSDVMTEIVQIHSQHNFQL